MIKAILLDLGNTLVPFDFRRGYARLEGLCRYPAAEIPKRIATTDLVTRFETGLIEPEPFVKELCTVLELDMGYDDFCHIWSDIFSPEPNIPESMLASLRQKYRLVLLSNTNALHFDLLWKNYPLLRQFHALVLSHKVHAMKPSPEIYAAAIENAGCRPEECFFTDDILAYVEGARTAGIDAVQFRGLEQLERELEARGVRW